MFALPKKLEAVIVLIGLVVLATACGGGGGDITSNLGGGDSPTVVGDVSTPPVENLDNYVPSQEITAPQVDAPLGTDPQYEVVPLEEGIETRPASKASSQTENELFWVSVVKRGETADPGLPSPPFYEGDQVDLYVHYEVFEGALIISREWHLEAAGLSLIQPAVVHPEPGIYEATLEFTIPYGSANTDAEFIAVIGAGRGVSAVVIPDQSDFRSVSFEILETPTLAPVNYPENPDALNDQQGGDGGCVPAFIDVTFNGTSVDILCEKDLSNVVLEFEDGTHEKWDDLDQVPVGNSGTFYGTGENEDKVIVRCWVKSGCNDSGEGPGYGERFEPAQAELGMAQMAWEDLLVGSDYDYNDFLARMRATEIRNLDNELVQVTLTIKAVARAAGYNGDWQFNVDASFPGTTVYAIVDQYYADGTRHGDQRLWRSNNGASIPIFSPTRGALPNPPESNITNGIPGTTFMDGDYAVVTILLDTPLAQGTYTPMPYEPELLIKQNSTSTWIIGLWTEVGDPVDDNGRPLAFIVPDTYAWPLEGVPITTPYARFADWIDWIGNNGAGDEPKFYDDEPASGVFDIGLFN